MKKKSRNSHKNLDKDDSPQTLIDPAGMGGIIGAGGYDYQTRYAICEVPRLLNDASFSGLLMEGTGDIDIRFGKEKSETREHVQVKDHTIKAAELREVIEGFVKWEDGFKDVYQKYILACPSLDASVTPLFNGLKRIRDAAPFFKGAPDGVNESTKKINDRIKDLRLNQHETFIHEKLYLLPGLSNYHDDDQSSKLFAGNLGELTRYKSHALSELQRPFPALFTYLSKQRGKLVSRGDLEKVINDAIASKSGVATAVIHLDIHNWTRENYEPPADYTVDWSAKFARDTRTIPDSKCWNDELLPELRMLSAKIVKTGPCRRILFRGKCCLSTSLALGAVFAENGGWAFEVQQPQVPGSWRSDDSPSSSFSLNTSVTILDDEGSSLLCCVDVTGDSEQEVLSFAKKQRIPVKAFLRLSPLNNPSSRSISSAGEAVAFSIAARDELKRQLAKHGLSATHLFYYGPQGIGLFLGQRFTSVGTIHIYEYQNPSYIETCTVRT